MIKVAVDDLGAVNDAVKLFTTGLGKSWKVAWVSPKESFTARVGVLTDYSFTITGKIPVY